MLLTETRNRVLGSNLRIAAFCLLLAVMTTGCATTSGVKKDGVFVSAERLQDEGERADRRVVAWELVVVEIL